MELDHLEALLHGRTPALMDVTDHFAVLVPLVRRADGLYLLYEVRARSLASQPGEVCFPGGRMETGEDATACALRETWEELGIPGEKVRVLGQLDFIVHRANFIMYPVLGLLEEEALAQMKPNPPEVEAVFLVPLSHLRTTTPGAYSCELRPHMGADFPYEKLGITPEYNWRMAKEQGPIYPWEGRVIWGLTGKITRHLMNLMNE